MGEHWGVSVKGDARSEYSGSLSRKARRPPLRSPKQFNNDTGQLEPTKATSARGLLRLTRKQLWSTPTAGICQMRLGNDDAIRQHDKALQAATILHVQEYDIFAASISPGQIKDNSEAPPQHPWKRNDHPATRPLSSATQQMSCDNLHTDAAIGID